MTKLMHGFSFPFGGMENPCMSFVTPTILAGDRSLVALIAHELSHAWSGNLVSNATWRDFWLNVGFTVYIEQRIIEQLFGVERARMETILGLRELARQFRRLPEDDQRLHIDLAGRDPDAAITAVPYDKGAAFLRRIERDVGRNRFDEFLAHWFKSHEFQSVTTYDFLDFLDKELPEIATRIDVDAWVNGPGIPDELTPSSEAFERVDAARATWLAGGPARAIDASSWATTHWQHFLAELPENLSVDRIAELDAAFDMAGVRNCEIECAWLQLAIRGGYDKADARVEEFLLSVGRRKLLRPLYRELMKTADGQQRAKAIYSRARPRYHTVSRRQIDDIVDWE